MLLQHSHFRSNPSYYQSRALFYVWYHAGLSTLTIGWRWRRARLVCPWAAASTTSNRSESQLRRRRRRSCCCDSLIFVFFFFSCFCCLIRRAVFVFRTIRRLADGDAHVCELHYLWRHSPGGGALRSTSQLASLTVGDGQVYTKPANIRIMHAVHISTALRAVYIGTRARWTFCTSRLQRLSRELTPIYFAAQVLTHLTWPG